VITPKLANEIIMYSPLHDVGKIAITDTILKKTGVLTMEEFQVMKEHTVYGGDLLRKTSEFLSGGGRNNLQVAIDIAERHHERYDGTGYPGGLAGEDIPIAARIVSLADIYDALRSPRPYKPTLTHEDSYKIITEGDGRTMPGHFDPRVLQAFKDIHMEFKKAYPETE
jgi:HD-GYP domain-containing protein (c-di-GMP phosphodiesterase class II)